MRPVGEDIGPTHDALSIERDELHGIVRHALANEALNALQWRRFNLRQIPLARHDVEALAKARRVARGDGDDGNGDDASLIRWI
jgi:hypothetical protein